MRICLCRTDAVAAIEPLMYMISAIVYTGAGTRGPQFVTTSRVPGPERCPTSASQNKEGWLPKTRCGSSARGWSDVRNHAGIETKRLGLSAGHSVLSVGPGIIQQELRLALERVALPLG